MPELGDLVLAAKSNQLFTVTSQKCFVGLTKLLVATGAYNLQSAEVVNLDEANPDLVRVFSPEVRVQWLGGDLLRTLGFAVTD